MRLDKYLEYKLNYSRTKIVKIIKSGYVYVNNKIVIKPSFLISPNAQIKIDEKYIEYEKKDSPLLQSKKAIKIVYEDDDLLIIDKQKGLLVYPTNFNEKDTLANRLIYYLGDSIKNNIRYGIVHRMDRNTTGLLLIAKNKSIFHNLQQQIRDKKIVRKYLAICHRHFKDSKLIINAPIAFTNNKTIKRKVSFTKNAKKAITYITLIKNLDNNLSLVECELKTGRTHQIRVHLAYIKHPIYNDELYGSVDFNKQYGQFLHAYKLAFIHPIKKKYMEFKINPDKIFLNLCHNVEIKNCI